MALANVADQDSNQVHSSAARAARPAVLVSAIAHRFHAILDALTEITKSHERLQPGGSLASFSDEERRSREAAAGAMENELMRLRKAVDGIVTTGPRLRQVAAFFLRIAPRAERPPTRTERAILEFAERVTGAAFFVHGLTIGSLEIAATAAWESRHWPWWNSLWTGLRKALLSASIEDLRRRLQIEGRPRFTRDMRLILDGLDGKRRKLRALEGITKKSRKYLLRKDRRTLGPLSFLVVEGVVVPTRHGYERPDRPPRDELPEGSAGTERPP